MPGSEGDFKKIEISGNTLIITLDQYGGIVHMIKTSEFCGIVYTGGGAIIHFIHYPSIYMKGFSSWKDEKTIKKLFTLDVTGDLLSL